MSQTNNGSALLNCWNTPLINYLLYKIVLKIPPQVSTAQGAALNSNQEKSPKILHFLSYATVGQKQQILHLRMYVCPAIKMSNLSVSGRFCSTICGERHFSITYLCPGHVLA